MVYVDVHCHLDTQFFNKYIKQVVQRAKEQDVVAIATGIDSATNKEVVDLHAQYPDTIYAALGLYPPDAITSQSMVEKSIDDELGFIREHANSIVAIGEIGMDAKHGKDLEFQEQIFRKCVELAISLDKPIVVHSRQAEEQVISVLESYQHAKIIMHCFGGKQRLVRRIRENKWMFSIPTSVVRDQHFQLIVKETPIHLLFCETDAPFLSPFQDKKNEPSFVIESYKKIAQIKRMPLEDVKNIIERNVKYTFGIQTFK